MDGIGRDAEKGASDTYGINGTLSRLTVRDNWPLQMKKGPAGIAASQGLVGASETPGMQACALHRHALFHLYHGVIPRKGVRVQGRPPRGRPAHTGQQL